MSQDWFWATAAFLAVALFLYILLLGAYVFGASAGIMLEKVWFYR